MAGFFQPRHALDDRALGRVVEPEDVSGLP